MGLRTESKALVRLLGYEKPAGIVPEVKTGRL